MKAIQALAASARIARMAGREWLKKQGWSDWRSATQAAHRPENMAALEPRISVRARLAYDELLAHQLVLALVRRDRKSNRAAPINRGDELQARLRSLLPFPLTGSQESAISDIAEDMEAQCACCGFAGRCRQRQDRGRGYGHAASCGQWCTSRADGTD